MKKALLLPVISIFLQLINVSYAGNPQRDALKQSKLPPCKACRTLADSFKKGIERTSRGKFEGGDTVWEEEKLGSYAKSEIRLVEIQESLCSDVEEGSDQCYSLHEQNDNDIEEWWFKLQDSKPDIFHYLCIEKLQYCCPDLHFGINCTPCPGYPDNICHNNGKCKGSGTRKGNGKCSCNQGYSGVACEECAKKYFASYKDENKMLCSKCHISCEGPCNKAGPTGCEKCASGWLHDKEKGCLDINECAAGKRICNPLQFCVNSEGSFKCLNCDQSCAGCTGDGPDMCTRCARGYTLVDSMCLDSEQENRKQHIFFTRYLTYLGLCVATCIIFQRSTIFAALIGLAVAAYITVSEYMLNTPPIPDTADLANRLLKATS